MFIKRILFIIPLALTSCYYDYFYLPPSKYYNTMTYNELTNEIKYFEYKLQMENRKCYYNQPHSHSEIKYIQEHLRRLSLRRFEIEYLYHCH